MWKTIQYALVDNECGSVIISTTRNLDVANKIGGVCQLQPLSLADSRKLFNLRIFGTEDKCLSNELAEVSTQILQKCGGCWGSPPREGGGTRRSVEGLNLH